MLHIGILGHSVPGSAHCYQEIARYAEERLGAYQHPDLTLDCIAMGRSMPAWHSGDREAVRAILAESVDRLARAGCDFFVCPDNTAHLALDLPGPELALPSLHIAEVVAAEAAARGYRKVGIMGTAWTMTADLYPKALAAHGIDSAAPTEADQRDVQSITFDELVHGVFRDEARDRFVAVAPRAGRGGVRRSGAGVHRAPAAPHGRRGPAADPRLDQPPGSSGGRRSAGPAGVAAPGLTRSRCPRPVP